MQLNKKRISNLLLVLFLGILFFTPIGFPIKVFVNKLISFSPTIRSKEQQNKLVNYDWQLQSSNGIKLNLSSVKGKVVFINTWATWCPPCVAEMPSIQELYSLYNEEVVFLSIAQDNSNRVNAYMKENNFTFPVYYQVSKIPKELDFNKIPTSFILDKEGNIVVEKTGAADWNSNKTKEILNKLVQ